MEERIKNHVNKEFAIFRNKLNNSKFSLIIDEETSSESKYFVYCYVKLRAKYTYSCIFKSEIKEIEELTSYGFCFIDSKGHIVFSKVFDKQYIK